MNPHTGGSSARAHRGDFVLALTVFVLLAFGLIMMYNINPALNQRAGGSTVNYFGNQLLNVAVGVAAWIMASSIYFARWQRFAKYMLLAALIGVFALMVPGLSYEANGATRWLSLGPLSFQPAEALKLALILYLATWLTRRSKEEKRSFWDGVFPFGVMIGIASILVVIFQRDMGTMLVIALSTLGMYFVAGLRLKHLALLLAVGGSLAWLAIVTFPHRLHRFVTFLDPMANCSGSGYHICQALIGIGSGGLFGTGLGKSIQIYGYLPEAPNDSIFAVIGEEFGIIGGLLLIGLFGLLVYRGFEVARKAPDGFSQLVAAGLTLVFMFQAFINIAAMLSLVPLTGIPLPFVSYGGSSLVIMMFAAGMLFNISKYTVREVEYADSRQRRGDSRPRLAGPSNRRRVTAAR